ncbi:unnamed protein product, partial [Allacma fusca]
KSMDFDYAILHLLSPLTLNENVAAISLPSPEFEPIRDCVTVGWGMISNDETVPLPDILYKVILPIVTRPLFLEIVGDSGGALMCKGVVAGIVSWGTDPCVQAEYPSVFANAASVRSWIDEQ